MIGRTGASEVSQAANRPCDNKAATWDMDSPHVADHFLTNHERKLHLTCSGRPFASQEIVHRFDPYPVLGLDQNTRKTINGQHNQATGTATSLVAKGSGIDRRSSWDSVFHAPTMIGGNYQLTIELVKQWGW